MLNYIVTVRANSTGSLTFQENSLKLLAPSNLRWWWETGARCKGPGGRREAHCKREREEYEASRRKYRQQMERSNISRLVDLQTFVW